MSKLEAAVMGRIGYDFYSEEPQIALQRVRRFSRYLGGSSANIAVGLSRLGARTGMIASLGTDALSQFLLDFLVAENVETRHIQQQEGYLPSLSITEVSPPDSFPQVFYRQAAADIMLLASESDLDYAASAHLFVTNGTSLCAPPSRESTYLALERAHEAGSKVALDIDFRAMSWPSSRVAGLAIRLALPCVDILIGNEPELMVAAGQDTLESALWKLRERGIPLLVSKLGSQGTRLYRGDESMFLPPYRVDVCTTIGAGDGFASGFLYGVLRGLTLEDCLHFGNAAAAIVVSRLSCSEAMPTLAEVEELMAAQHPQISRTH